MVLDLLAFLFAQHFGSILLAIIIIICTLIIRSKLIQVMQLLKNVTGFVSENNEIPSGKMKVEEPQEVDKSKEEVDKTLATRRIAQSQYDKQRYEKERQEVIELLGGKCSICGSAENLQFGHLFHRKNHGYRAGWLNVIDARKNPKDFLLLCEKCHQHPEERLKDYAEIIRRVAEEQTAQDMRQETNVEEGKTESVLDKVLRRKKE